VGNKLIVLSTRRLQANECSIVLVNNDAEDEYGEWYASPIAVNTAKNEPRRRRKFMDEDLAFSDS
jgi:hypothetical protein